MRNLIRFTLLLTLVFVCKLVSIDAQAQNTGATSQYIISTLGIVDPDTEESCLLVFVSSPINTVVGTLYIPGLNGAEEYPNELVNEIATSLDDLVNELIQELQQLDQEFMDLFGCFVDDGNGFNWDAYWEDAWEDAYWDALMAEDAAWNARMDAETEAWLASLEGDTSGTLMDYLMNKYFYSKYDKDAEADAPEHDKGDGDRNNDGEKTQTIKDDNGNELTADANGNGFALGSDGKYVYRINGVWGWGYLDDEMIKLCNEGSNPFDLNGNVTREITDLRMTGSDPLQWTRSNNSIPRVIVPAFGLGASWRHNWQYELQARSNETGDHLLFIYPDGVRRAFDRQPDGSFATRHERYEEKARLVGDNVEIITQDELTLVFEPVTADAVQSAAGIYRPVTLTNRNGQITRFDYDDNGLLQHITNDAGNQITIHYITAGGIPCINRVETSDRRTVEYEYKNMVSGTGSLSVDLSKEQQLLE